MPEDFTMISILTINKSIMLDEETVILVGDVMVLVNPLDSMAVRNSTESAFTSFRLILKSPPSNRV